MADEQEPLNLWTVHRMNGEIVAVISADWLFWQLTAENEDPKVRERWPEPDITHYEDIDSVRAALKADAEKQSKPDG